MRSVSFRSRLVLPGASCLKITVLLDVTSCSVVSGEHSASVFWEEKLSVERIVRRCGEQGLHHGPQRTNSSNESTLKRTGPVKGRISRIKINRGSECEKSKEGT